MKQLEERNKGVEAAKEQLKERKTELEVANGQLAGRITELEAANGQLAGRSTEREAANRQEAAFRRQLAEHTALLEQALADALDRSKALQAMGDRGGDGRQGRAQG